MKTQFEKLREKINEAQNEIKNEKGEIFFIFNKALESVLITMDEIEKEKEFKIGNFYFSWNLEENGFIYGKLVEIDEYDEELPYKIHIGGSIQSGWFEYISENVPLDLMKPINN
jgi:hypothetical protein